MLYFNQAHAVLITPRDTPLIVSFLSALTCFLVSYLSLRRSKKIKSHSYIYVSLHVLILQRSVTFNVDGGAG